MSAKRRIAEAGSQAVKLDGHEIELTKLDKIYFPDSGISKGDLVSYYRRIAPFALPHMAGRPLTMERWPDGIAKKSFIQKQIPRHFPGWMKRVTFDKEGGRITQVIAEDAATLVYIANQGSITPHLMLSRRDRLDHPDIMILDLDPSDGDFRKVQKGAKRLKDALAALELRSFVKSTGSRGLHIVVPLDRREDFDAVRGFARRLSEALAVQHPDLFTVAQRKKQRGDRVFLDYLRNGFAQTAVAPFAVRARPGAPVALPLDWSEALSEDFTPARFSLANVFQRLSARNDPWEGIYRCRQSLKEAARKLEDL